MIGIFLRKGCLFSYLLLIICMSSLSAYAQSWNSLVGKRLPLLRYGLYENGAEKNSFTPSQANRNQGEFIQLNANGTLFWGSSGNGSQTYNYRIDGKFLYLTGNNNNTWLRCDRNDGNTIFTVDRYNTYRYYSLNNSNPTPVNPPSEGLSPYTFSFSTPAGGTCQVTINTDNSMDVYEKNPCRFCRGSKICQGCNGAGGIYGRAYGGMYYPCTMCYQTGKCHSCKGEGWVTTQTHVKDGYGTIWSSNGYYTVGTPDGCLIYSPNGRVTARLNPRYNRPSRSTSNCGACGGTGYERKMYSASADHRSYLNPSGQRCSFCGDYSRHYHYPCLQCRLR